MAPKQIRRMAVEELVRKLLEDGGEKISANTVKSDRYPLQYR
ncbi:hypothetical protein NSB25_03585 [Acetatifactor muris]|nr:hypothetical protein [Acetatifactor muris]MCR2046358.1 hypothetical protein [Acetatifactor muris]